MRERADIKAAGLAIICGAGSDDELERIGLIEILMILFILVTIAATVAGIVYIIRRSLKKRTGIEDKVSKLEKEVNELKKKL